MAGKEDGIFQISLTIGDTDYTALANAGTMEMLNSLDPNVRSMAVSNLVNMEVVLPEQTDSKLKATDLKDQECIGATSPEAQKGTKVWTTKEAKTLFEMRKEYEEKFGSMKCHKTLWAQISSSLSKAGVVASAMQCSNKWKSLKREYKKTIDHNSHTGNEKKTCQFYEDFNEMYGHRSGTQPEFVMSSRSTEKECRRKSDSHNDESLESPGPSSTIEKEKKVPKRKGRQDANLEFLEKYAKKQESFQKDRLDLLKEQHVEKMSMMDKLINRFKQK